MDIAAWVQAISTVALVIITFFYVKYTRSLAQLGREPVLFIGDYGVVNILFEVKIQNRSDFFAKNIEVFFLSGEEERISLNGPKVLYPQRGVSKHEGCYKGIREPSFKIDAGDLVEILYQSVTGKRFKQIWRYEEYEDKENKTKPYRFVLIDITEK